jgi:hypothetical protein
MLGTKEPSPPELRAWMDRAMDLDELRRCGATFGYPDGLTAAEWACLKAYARAMNEAQRRARKRAEAQSKQ